MLGPKFTDIRHLDSVDSTNRYLLDLARSGAPEGVVVVADHQSAGRGRLGRRWEAPAGANLLTSVLLRPDLPADRRYLASAVVALAAADGATTAAGVTLDLKWPNDLLAGDGRKVAGVLAEADLDGVAGASPPRPAIVVGVGVNVNWPATDADLPAELVGTATSLCQLAGAPVDRSSLLSALLAALEPRVADLGTPDGRRRQVEELRARCVTVGARVRVDLPDGSFEGTATGLTDEGHLVVEDQAGIRRTVVAGDVVHVRAAPSPVDRPPGPAGDPVPGGVAGPEYH
jgi:BirA family biotin operon repressor/biotin-[acetyl-CoA-carboxylase] ligase